MSQLVISIPTRNEKFITTLLLKLGCLIKTGKDKDMAVVSSHSITPAEDDSISPSYLFGKWADMDIDTKTFRKKIWSRSA